MLSSVTGYEQPDAKLTQTHLLKTEIISSSQGLTLCPPRFVTSLSLSELYRVIIELKRTIQEIQYSLIYVYIFYNKNLISLTVTSTNTHTRVLHMDIIIIILSQTNILIVCLNMQQLIPLYSMNSTGLAANTIYKISPVQKAKKLFFFVFQCHFANHKYIYFFCAAGDPRVTIKMDSNDRPLSPVKYIIK